MDTKELANPRDVVKANNDLFRARYKIKDVVAGRIFMAFASLVNEKDVKENQSFLEYKISASSIIKDNTGGDNYKQLRDAAYALIDQKLEKKKSKNSFSVYTLFSKIEYDNGIITGQFHKDLVPFFIAARGMFTRLNLQQYMELPSIYSQRLFGFLRSYSYVYDIDITLKDLHELLDTPDSLREDFFNFRQRVLEKAYKDILKYTDLNYEWTPIKQGRAVVSIRFIFSRKKALPVAKKKTDDAKEKQSQRNNAAVIKAMNCLKERGVTCAGGHQKKSICDICLKFRPQESCQK